MAYTITDLENVQAAVTALATGSRKVSVLINGKRIEYAPVQLHELISLRNQIQSEVSTTRRRFVLISTSKGL